MLGIGLSLTGRLRSSVSIFSPVSLFSSNEPGIWLDPSDVANLAWRRNLLTRTEEFDNAVWGRVNATSTNPSVSANQGIAPDGTMTADLVTFGVIDAAGDVSIIRQISGSQTNTQQTGSVYLKAANSFQVGKRVYVYLNDVVAINAFTPVVLSLDWQRVSVTGSYTGNDRYLSLATSGSGNFDGLGSNTDRDAAVLIWGAQLELGSVATDYQKITDVNTEVIERFPSATLYQDTAGTTPVTTPGQTVALALDKSKGLVLGSELVNNANWSAVSSATVSVSGTTVTVTDPGGVPNFQAAILDVTTVAGKWYEFSGFVVSTTDPRNVVTLNIWNGAFSNILYTRANIPVASSVSAKFQAIGSTTRLHLVEVDPTNTTAKNWVWRDISVKELPGFHATQATLASRPTYGIVPVGGRRNLLTRTEEFGDAAWTKNGLTASGGVLTATSTIARIYQASTLTSGVAHTYSVKIKAGTAPFAAIRAVGYDTQPAAWFNLSAGTLGTAESGITSTISAVDANGFYRCTVRFTTTTDVVGDFSIYPANANVDFTVTVGRTIEIKEAQLETGSSATAYQRVGSAFDVTEAGVQSLSYLSFDGVDDFLVTPTITPGIDRAQVFAGVRKLSDPAFAVIAETSASFNSNAGSLLLFTNPGLNGFVSRGSATGGVAGTIGATAPVTSVLTGLGDIAVDVSNIRQNGIAGTAGTGDQGTGNYLAYPMYIGRRGGTLNPINMQLFSLITRFGTNLDAGTITSTETYVNEKTGAYT